MTIEPLRQPFRLLGCALAISFVLAFPMERVVHATYLGGFGSCSDGVQIALNLGNIAQAILPPILIFLLPGPGCILRKKTASKPALRPWQPALFMSAAWLCSSVVPIAWWYWLREYAANHNTCGELFDLGRTVDVFHVNYFSDLSHYFIDLSVFSAFWVGITAGGLRLQSARAAEGDPIGNESGQFQHFYWICFLGWAVQYRLSQWLLSPLGRGQTEWVGFARLYFIILTVSSLWALAFTHSLWNKRPRTRREAVLQAFWRSVLIHLFTALTFIWSPIIAGGALNFAFVTLNAFGFAWAWTVGTWRWRSLQKQLIAVAPQD